MEDASRAAVGGRAGTAVREARVDEIAATVGFTKRLAERVKELG